MFNSLTSKFRLFRPSLRAVLAGISTLLLLAGAIALGVSRGAAPTSSGSRSLADDSSPSPSPSPSPLPDEASAAPVAPSPPVSRAGGSGPAPGPPPERTYCISTDFAISNSLDKTEYDYEEDVPLHMQVSYRGPGPCYLEVLEDRDRAFFVGSVSGESGEDWSDPPRPCRPVHADTITIEWDPGQTRTWDVVWHQEVRESNQSCGNYGQADEGEYDYVASYGGFKDCPSDMSCRIQSPKIRFSIGPNPSPSPSPSGPLPL